jgi:hypothetical protein
MHADLLHHLSRTITACRPTGMALALAAISARTVGTTMDAALITVLTDACTLCLADVAARGEGELHLPLDAATLLVLRIGAVQPLRLALEQVVQPTQEAVCAG